MTRFWPAGEAIIVQADQLGAPLAFAWKQRSHVVQRVVQRWRVQEGWWLFPAWRDYFMLCTHSGLLVILYRDLLGGGWYLQRVYD